MLAVVIPCFKVKKHISSVINSIGTEVGRIYVIDDACPENSGEFVRKNVSDRRVKVLFHKVNLGVGGAVMTGYQEALKDGCEIVVKIDGDGQMDTRYLAKLIDPILRKNADYTKGNRFYDVEHLKSMPTRRMLGNAGLTFATKLMTGYWSIFDPTNGYTAISNTALSRVPFEKISKRYFFESDMLFRLGLARAVVKDIPMPARYQDEKSSLRIGKVLFEFPPKIILRLFKRIAYKYFVRDFNLGTIYLVGALLFMFTGGIYGGYHMISNYINNAEAPSGVVMLAGLPIILGFQLLLSFFSYDLFTEPVEPIQRVLADVGFVDKKMKVVRE